MRCDVDDDAFLERTVYLRPLAHVVGGVVNAPEISNQNEACGEVGVHG